MTDKPEFIELPETPDPDSNRAVLAEMLAPDSPPWRAATLRGTLCPPSWVELVEPLVDLSVYDAFLREEVAHVG